MPPTMIRMPITAFNFPLPIESSWTASGLQELPEMALNVGDISILGFTCRAGNHFDTTFRNLLSNIHTQGNSDQVGVFKLHAWTFVSVVQQDSKSHALQLLRNLFRSLQ